MVMKINEKLDFWQKRLLDLGKRNRLINCPVPGEGKRVQRHSLLIDTPTSADIWELFIDGDGVLTFPLPQELQEQNSQGQLSLLGSELEEKDEASYIKTNQSPNEAHKTLRSLKKKAKEFTEEKGLNALHLAFGFLNWKENGLVGQEMRSPLLLLPVKLEQEDLFSPIVLSRLDEEVSANYSLELKLLNDFNIELPTPSGDINFCDFLREVNQSVKAMGWSVSDDVTQISLFSFMKINMYRDLERHAEKICGHHIIRAINGESIRDGINISNVNNYDHDSTDPTEVFSVVDSDSSQQDAILLSKRGSSFVLQGPPGTGKSQTITNIIAELIADGKRVLFVSEKMAALEVVYKRLSQVGLADFCLTLHSPNAKRRDILDQFDNSIKLSRSKIELQQDAYNRLYRLKEIRDALNRYNTELHTKVEPLGKTIFQINSYLAQLEYSRNIDFVQSGAETFTQQLLAQCESALEEVMRIVAKSGYQQTNPWNGCILTQPPTFEFRQRFLVDTVNLAKQIEEGTFILTETNDILDNMQLEWCFNETLVSIKHIFDCAKKSPKLNPSWISLNLQSTISNLGKCVSYINECKSLQSTFISLTKDRNTISSYIEDDCIADCLQTKNPEIANAIDFYNDSLRKRQSLSESLTLLTAKCKSIDSDVYEGKTINFEQTCNSEIIKVVKLYNIALDKKNSLITAKLDIELSSFEIEKRLQTSEQVYVLEQSKRDKADDDFQNAYCSLLERCSEKVLTLDVRNILTRYRTDYRSWTRVLSTSYRNDRRSLLEHCKRAEKLTYEQGLILLDTVNNVKELRDTLKTQTEIASNAKSLLEEVGIEYDQIIKQLHDVNNELAYAESELKKMKERLNSTTDNEMNLLSKKLLASESEYDISKVTLTNIMTEKLSLLERQLSERKRLFPETQQAVSLRQDLGIDIGKDTDFSTLHAKLEWSLQFQNLKEEYQLGDRFVAAICERDMSIFNRADANISNLQDWEISVTPELCKFANLFDEQRKQAIYLLPLRQLNVHISDCKDNFASLEYLIDYRIAYERLKSLGIDAYLNKSKEIDLSADEIIPVFKKCFFRSWLDIIVPRFPAISEFRRLRQDERVKTFKVLDKEHLEISKAMLISKLVSQLPNFDAYSSNGEMALLRREMAKQRRLMPTRLLIAALSNLLPALKPCMMMSPLSVSTYLGSINYEFDTVIFDEASQVRTEDAIGAIFRAKQAIIVGDRKQLPPTDFFNASMSSSDEYEENEEGETNDAGAFESLLDEATMLPTQTLLWHYRSKHEHLITFSNAKIYQNDLITFPSSSEDIKGMGVEYVYVNGGIYNRGGRNGNQAEAEKVAELVFEHLLTYQNRSLGIIAFGEVQQTAIQDALIVKRRANPTFEQFFKENKEEPIFIKNLETVQGDERDTIIFSIGYAPDETGKFMMNFGPLSRNGGERRLNVAITRARYNMKLVGSIMPTDIDIDRISGLGPKLLRQYIDFAINGTSAIWGEVTADRSLSFDSPFETSVYNFLTSNGYDVVTQVGCSGYRIDMAVRHPRYNGRYAIGIECDGAMYHSSRTARERDRLRQTVLEDMGWSIYRVWSTDWIKDSNTEGGRLLRAVKNAIDNYREIIPSTDCQTAKLTDYISVNIQSETEHMKEGIKEKHQILRSMYYGYNAKEIPNSNIAEVMIKVITCNFGLDKEGLFKETALYGYGWERQGKIIKSKFETAYLKLIRQNRIKENFDGKISLEEEQL